MSRLDFSQTGPTRGDCTAPYSVTFEKPMTVRSLVSEVVSNERDWGYIGIKNEKEPFFGDPCCEYRWGRLLTELPPEIMDRNIEAISANGGWTRMDYILTLEEKEAPIC